MNDLKAEALSLAFDVREKALDFMLDICKIARKKGADEETLLTAATEYISSLLEEFRQLKEKEVAKGEQKP